MAQASYLLVAVLPETSGREENNLAVCVVSVAL